MSSKKIPVTVLDETYERGVRDAERGRGPNPSKSTIWEPQLSRMYRAGYDAGACEASQAQNRVREAYNNARARYPVQPSP